MTKTIVVKIGGSTWESRDTALDDVIALQREGHRIAVVHGGGEMVNLWLAVHAVESHFVDGVRMTTHEALPVAVAVLAGLVNKQLVAAINAAGGRAIGLSGADGPCIVARRRPELGFVGEIERVDVGPLTALLDAGYLPVIASIGIEDLPPGSHSGQLLNINADSVAGAVAVALKADLLVFLTDVAGVLDAGGKTIGRASASDVEALLREGTISRGMLPKVAACLRASESGSEAVIVDGRQPGALRAAVEGRVIGTRVG